MQAHELHKKEVKNGKKVKKAENRNALPLAWAKKELIALTHKKSQIKEKLFEVSVIKNFFLSEKNIHQISKTTNLKKNWFLGYLAQFRF